MNQRFKISLLFLLLSVIFASPSSAQNCDITSLSLGGPMSIDCNEDGTYNLHLLLSGTQLPISADPDLKVVIAGQPRTVSSYFQTPGGDIVLHITHIPNSNISGVEVFVRLQNGCTKTARSLYDEPSCIGLPGGPIDEGDDEGNNQECRGNTDTRELIVNGDFESGSFMGWELQTFGGNNGFQINSGAPGGPFATPISGNYDILVTQSGPGMALVSQLFILPKNITGANFSWKDRIESHAEFADPQQEYRVVLRDSDQNTIAEIFSTNPGDPTSQLGPNLRKEDLTNLLKGYEGQAVCIAFEEEDNFAPLFVSLDDISLEVTGCYPKCDITELSLACPPACKFDGTYGFHIEIEGTAIPTDPQEMKIKLDGQDVAFTQLHATGNRAVYLIKEVEPRNRQGVDLFIELETGCTFTSRDLFDEPACEDLNCQELEMIINGGFETGDLTGWETKGNSGEMGGGQGFAPNNGMLIPEGPVGPNAPLNGNYDITNLVDGPGYSMVYQSITVPHSMVYAELSWVDRVLNSAPHFLGSQNFSVDLLDKNLEGYTELFSMEGETPSIQPDPNYRNIDITNELKSFAGEEIVISFRASHEIYFLNLYLDDISLKIVTCGEDEGGNNGECDMTGMEVANGPVCNGNGTYDLTLEITGENLPANDPDAKVIINHQPQPFSIISADEHSLSILVEDIPNSHKNNIEAFIQLANGCSYTVRELYDEPDCQVDRLGKDETPQLQLFPNPATNKINITAVGVESGIITILNLQGKEILRKEVKGNVAIPLSLDQFPKGVYMVRLTSNDFVSTKKLILAE